MVVALLATPMVCHAAAASWKPEKNVEIISDQSHGAEFDIMARLIQRLLIEEADRLRAMVVNKVGGDPNGATLSREHAVDGWSAAIPIDHVPPMMGIGASASTRPTAKCHAQRLT